jgi:hypothetical protein
LMQKYPDLSAFPYLIFNAHERGEPHLEDVRQPEAGTVAAAAHCSGWRRHAGEREKGK